MYGKIFESIYDGTLSADWRAMVTFQQFIVLADSEGIVDLTPLALSRRTGIPLKILEYGIARLQEPDPHSRSTEFCGQRIALLDGHRQWGWSIINYTYYRDLANMEDRREKDRERKRVERRKQSQATDADDRSNSIQGCPQASASVRNVRHEDEDEDANKDRDEYKTYEAAKRVPMDFSLTPDLVAFAEKAGMDVSQIEEEFAGFKDHEYKDAKKDWPAAWRTWCRNWKKWRGDEANSARSDDFGTIHKRNRVAAGLD